MSSITEYRESLESLKEARDEAHLAIQLYSLNRDLFEPELSRLESSIVKMEGLIAKMQRYDQ
jgi:hypothetical protein